MSTREGPPVAVAILSRPGFDARTVDAASVCFGDPNNATQRDCTESHGRGHIDDVDRDGDLDLLLHYDLGQTGFDSDDTRGCLEGRTADGTRIYGCDAVSVKNATAEAELPNLVVGVVAQPASANAHDAVRWTVTVRNTGIGAVTLGPGDELLSLTVPDVLSDVVITSPAGYACAAAVAGVTRCRTSDPDTIGVDGTRTFTVDAVLPDAPGAVTVSARVDPAGTVTELSEQDNTGEAAALVQTPNLTLTLVPEPGAVAPGDDVRWTATVRNDGPGAARVPAGAPLVRFAVPAGLSGVAFDAPTGDCTNSATVNIAAGDSVTITLSARTPATPGTSSGSAVAVVVKEGDETDNSAAATITSS
ncbi:MAG: hypothetical protein ACRDT4_09480 [Micromonosporaceae bacterium]